MPRPKKYKKKSPEEVILRRTYHVLSVTFGDKLSTDRVNTFCIQLLTLLYADVTGAFGDRLKSLYTSPDIKADLLEILTTLGTPVDSREHEDSLPYIDTGLFSHIDIPDFDSRDFMRLFGLADELSILSPADFTTLFESVLSAVERQNSGTFFTSVEFIHRVIDPLFLNSLKEELDTLVTESEVNVYIDKLGEIRILDPACGTANFLIESYLSLVELEKEAMSKLSAPREPVVSADQFYGIELSPLRVRIAETVFRLTQKNQCSGGDTRPVIVEANALTCDWNDVLDHNACSYLIGNPPFLGARVMDQVKKHEVREVFGEDWKNVGILDYVSCWFKKAYDYVKGTDARAAFLSTSSIVQGESVSSLWEPLLNDGLVIDFARQTFHWKTISRVNTGVYCVIIGFGHGPGRDPLLYTDTGIKSVSRINAYLREGEDVYIKSRRIPREGVPEIGIGNKPIDNGNYLFSASEMEEFIAKEPKALPYFHPYYGSIEFLKKTPRYCLYLKGLTDEEIDEMPLVRERVERVREFRLHSKSNMTRKLAETPTHFHVENIAENPYLLIPRSTSADRDYIPIGFMSPEDFSSDSVHIIKEASLYHFGVLTSSAHMEWVRAIGGRIGNGYRYSKKVIYNSFPWPQPTPNQKQAITETARNILTIRDEYSLDYTQLYDHTLMPEKLKKAHIQNDRAVLSAYGLDWTDDILSHLLALYD